MNYRLNPKDIDISFIDFADLSYSIAPDVDSRPDEALAESIYRHGILHPPIVKQIKRDRYVIVSGRKRLMTFQNIFPEEKTCTCLLIQSQVPEIDIFSIHLEEILTRRRLTPIERAIFLQKISSFTGEDSIAKDILPRIDLPPDPFHIKQSIKLLELETPLIDAIHQGIVNEQTAKDLLALSSNDRLALAEILSSLQPSISYQKKMLSICKELSNRENKTIAEVLEDTGVQEIINHQDANPPQKIKNLMHYLSRKHRPRNTQAEDEFKRFAASMELPGNVSINHTPYFEDDSVTLSINFPNRNDTQKAWEIIRDAIRKHDN